MVAINRAMMASEDLPQLLKDLSFANVTGAMKAAQTATREARRAERERAFTLMLLRSTLILRSAPKWLRAPAGLRRSRYGDFPSQVMDLKTFDSMVGREEAADAGASPQRVLSAGLLSGRAGHAAHAS